MTSTDRTTATVTKEGPKKAKEVKNAMIAYARYKINFTVV